MAKKQANPGATVIKRIPFPEKTIAQTNRPHCFFKIQVDNETPFRVVLELRPDMAPKMVDNFVKLCKGLPNGMGYKGSNIYRAKGDDHLLGGDFENNDGTGGHSSFEERYVLAEQCPLRDHKGAIRMRGQERTMDGRCKIGSQFMIWVGDLDYKEYRFTLVFGKVVEGFNQLLEVSRIKAVQKSPTSWILKQSVKIVDSGTL
jgi:cyclophilin family peptidyl-prolyl cis-trans isomerase